jgi:hypothetical protein
MVAAGRFSHAEQGIAEAEYEVLGAATTETLLETWQLLQVPSHEELIRALCARGNTTNEEVRG